MYCFFTEIDVKENIISYFLSKLEYRETELDGTFNQLHHSGKSNISSIGPFLFDEVNGKYQIRSHDQTKISTGGNIYLTPILVAFKVAQNIIDHEIEQKRIVPKYLLNQFRDEKYVNIFTALENIQTKYDQRNATEMTRSVVHVTDLICDLIIPNSSNKTDNKIGEKLKRLYDDKKLCDTYSIKRGWIWALNNARLIRNIDMHNKPEPTTLFEATGYCHILMILISSIMSSGKLNIPPTPS